MKEVIAVIRMNMINQTKEALLKEGFPSMHCRKVMGRGKKKVDASLLEEFIKDEKVEFSVIARAFSETHRLIPKRMITLYVRDDEVKTVIDTITSINRTGNCGDGKIFVLEAEEVVRIRTGERGETAII